VRQFRFQASFISKTTIIRTFECGAVGVADGVLCGFTGMLGAYLGADDLVAVDHISRFGAHGRALQCSLRVQAMPLGFEVRNRIATL
jgi:hypothetical protein